MKIATNVHRDAFGGITISNLALFDWLEDKDDTIVGIEYITTRHILGAVIFRRYLPSFFKHHVINGIDIIPKHSWETSFRLRKRWDILVETTKRVLRDEQPDVVLINGTYYAPWILMQAAKELGIPIVVRYAGVLQREIMHKSYLTRKRLLKYERQIAEIANAIIFPSALCQRVVENEVLGHKVHHGTIIPNPTKLQTLGRRRRSTRFTIAAIGRWTPIKNFQAYVKLHEQLLKERWPHRAMLVTSFRDDKFNLPETLEFVDPMNQEDLRAFYRSVDLVVVTSRFETFCNVAAEAVICGTQVLVSEQVGFAEVLRKAGLGRMVIPSFDEPAQVTKAVKELARTRLTAKERLTVAKMLDPQDVHEDIITVLESVLRQH